MDPKQFLTCLQDREFSFFAGVPDSLLKDFCACVTDTLNVSEHVIAANEGAAVALASGHFLGTGKPAVVYLQNSGLGNIINPLTSLADADVYSIPMLFLIGWRGEPGVKDEPQHVKQGRVTLAVLDALEVPYLIVDKDTDPEKAISDACTLMQKTSAPVAMLVRKGTFESYKLKSIKPNTSYPLSREQAIKKVVTQLNPSDLIVSTTGFASRELYEHRVDNGQSLSSDFLTVGSMGHSSSIALGLALSQPDRKVFCLDGDGSLLMHMGSVAVTGHTTAPNLVHIVLNNGVHDSVGGQPTVGFSVDFCAIAKACGYSQVHYVETTDEIKKSLLSSSRSTGPAFIEIRLQQGTRKDLGRPKSTPQENRTAFMKNLGL